MIHIKYHAIFEQHITVLRILRNWYLQIPERFQNYNNNYQQLKGPRNFPAVFVPSEQKSGSLPGTSIILCDKKSVELFPPQICVKLTWLGEFLVRSQFLNNGAWT